MVNLAEEQWISVACSEPLLSHVVCMNKINRSISLTPVSMMPEETYCEKHSIILNQSCYTFHWFGQTNTNGDILAVCKKSRQCVAFPPVALGTKQNIIYSVLFKALSLDTFRVVSLENGVLTFYTYTKVMIDTLVDTFQNNMGVGFYACMSRRTITTLGGLLFQCNDSTVLPKVFLYDGKIDCGQGRDRTDETLDLGVSVQKNDCSPLLYRNKQGFCQSYMMTNNFEQETMSHNFVCPDGLLIPSTQLNDLVADCTDGEDEMQYKRLLSTGHMHSCKFLNTLPCVAGHTKCYQFSDICTYRIYNFRHLIPCRTGGHIQECNNFECNHHFKCPAHYCVPWAYTCDGKWDCPEGHDEFLCNQERNCSFMMKCKDSSLCLHIADHCDGHSDCPGNDDELLCIVYQLHCPKGCVCLNLALLCQNQKMLVLDSNIVHVASLFLVNCGIRHTNFLTYPQNLIIVNISCNKIVLLPEFSLGLNHVALLDASHNFLWHLHTNTFCGMSLHNIILNNNNISKIQANCFCHLLNVSVLNLADNNINSLHQNMFKNVSKIYVLNLADNPLAVLTMDVFGGTVISIDIIYSNDSRICCMKPQGSECFPLDPSLCHSPLPSEGNQITLLVISIAIVLTNLCSLSGTIVEISNEKKQAKHKQGKGSPYHSIVCAILCTHIVFSFYLFAICGMTIHHGSSYFLSDKLWRKGLWCTFSSFLVMFHIFSQPLLFLFLAVARLQVIQHPLQSGFKSIKFVVSWLLVVIVFILCVALLCVVFLRIEQKMLSKFCLPPGRRNQTSWVNKALMIVATAEQVLALVLILAFYIVMSKSIIKSQASVGKSQNMQPFYNQVAALIISHTVSWIPLSVFFIISTFQADQSDSILMHLLSFVKPVECFTTPILFLVLLKKNKQDQSKEKKPRSVTKKSVSVDLTLDTKWRHSNEPLRNSIKNTSAEICVTAQSC